LPARPRREKDRASRAVESSDFRLAETLRSNYPPLLQPHRRRIAASLYEVRAALMNFEISHRTSYSYSAPVSQSYHLLHLEPRPHSRQTVLRHSLLIDPAPASRTDLIDDFGNPVSI